MKEVELYQKYHTTSRVKTRYRVKNLSGRYLWIEVTGVRAEYNGVWIRHGWLSQGCL
ncbi:hypothetical protein [Vibrio cidicii]|uniref:hypothetical protein n=1 Tax=Vibrio cidicii TaxID=1763883 RepID=UPI003704994D